MTLTRTTALSTTAALSIALLMGSVQGQTTTAPATTSTTSGATSTSTLTTTRLTQQQQAAQAAAEARDLAARARSAYPPGTANIDQPLWKQAAAAAEAAVIAAPGNPDYLRLRAQIYTEVGFWRMAQLSWEAYFRAAPFTVGSDDAKQAATVQYNLGYAAYTRAQPEQAATFFNTCLEFDAGNVPCLTWAARTALETGNYTLAQSLYARALTRAPNDKTLTYFSAVTQNAGRYGPAATRAFSRAYGELEAGRKTQALTGFQEAARTAPNFAEAWREAGRLALELGNARDALAAYTGLNALPNPTAADQYNLGLATEGEQYGLPAVRAFRSAYARYVAGDRTGAEFGFLEAVNLNAAYAKAWAWLGRVRYELKNYPGAVEAYSKAVALDPNDKTSAYYLKLAGQQK